MWLTAIQYASSGISNVPTHESLNSTTKKKFIYQQAQGLGTHES